VWASGSDTESKSLSLPLSLPPPLPRLSLRLCLSPHLWQLRRAHDRRLKGRGCRPQCGPVARDIESKSLSPPRSRYLPPSRFPSPSPAAPLSSWSESEESRLWPIMWAGDAGLGIRVSVSVSAPAPVSVSLSLPLPLTLSLSLSPASTLSSSSGFEESRPLPTMGPVARDMECRYLSLPLPLPLPLPLALSPPPPLPSPMSPPQPQTQSQSQSQSLAAPLRSWSEVEESRHWPTVWASDAGHGIQVSAPDSESVSVSATASVSASGSAVALIVRG
jgi:hypothetical protein